MLKVLRKKGVMKKVLWVIAITIIVAFGFMGQSYVMRDRNETTYAGKIFGKKVSYEDFERGFEQTQIQAILRYGENFHKIREFLNLEAETWDRLILLHEAKKRHITIPDKDVVEAIQNYPFFQRNGKFDRELYNLILQRVIQVRPRTFEEGVRDSLKFAKIFAEETAATAAVSAEDVLNAYKSKNERAQVSYVLVPTENFKDKVTFNEAGAKDYFSNHKDEFVLPPMVNVEFIRVDFPASPTKAPAAAETKDAATNPDETPATAMEEDNPVKDAAFEKALEIAQELSKNPNFPQAAQKYNMPIETSGFFGKEQPYLKAGWSMETIQKIFQMAQGQTSEPIETAQSFQVLRVKDKKDSYIPEYDEVKDKVKEAWILQEAKKIAKEKAAEDSKLIKEKFESVKYPDFTAIAKELKLEIYQTPVFSRGQYLPAIGISKDFQNAAFALNGQNPLSDLVESVKGWCILHLDASFPADMENYDKEKEALGEALLSEQRNAAFNDFLIRLRLKANLEDNVSKRKAGRRE